MLQCMLDLETMATAKDAAIVAIGAVVFEADPNSPPDYRRFYAGVKLDSALRTGGVMDAETVLWWMGQTPASQEALLKAQEQGVPLRKVLYDFREWYLRHARRADVLEIPLWGNGADFDNVVLRGAYERNEIMPPWHHRANRCFRTVKNLFMPDFQRTDGHGVHHNAVDDAQFQAEWLRAIFAQMAGGGSIAALAPAVTKPEDSGHPGRGGIPRIAAPAPTQEELDYQAALAEAGNTAGL